MQSFRCPKCNKYIEGRANILNHILREHTTTALAAIIGYYNYKIKREVKWVKKEIDWVDWKAFEDVVRKIRQLEVKFDELPKVKYPPPLTDASPPPYIPFSGDMDKRTKEYLMWATHNPKLEGSKKKLDGYDQDHEALMNELGPILERKKLELE